MEEFRARRPVPPEATECHEPGEIASEAFKLLRDGADVRDVVIALRRPPSEIEALYSDWERLGDMLVVSWRVPAQLTRMADNGLIPAEMLEAIEADDGAALRDLVSDAIGDEG